ncbi:MAG: hypothetical protein U0R52_06900 [Solirubrobacterales bacterium]
MPGKLSGKVTYANVISTLCLFLILGGGAYAALRLPKNSVRSRNIVNRQVRVADLANGAVSNPKLGNGAVSADKVQDGSLTGIDVQDGSLGAGDLGPNSVGGTSVADGSLSTDDYAYATGTTALDLGSIAAQSCAESALINVPPGASNDPVIVTPSDSWVGVEAKLTYGTRLVGGAFNAFRVILCNITTAAVDPPSITFHWVMLNRP